MLTITLRCFGMSATHQPDPPVLEMPEGATLADVLARLKMPPELEFVILVDGGPATPATVLTRNGTVSLVPIVVGG